MSAHGTAVPHTHPHTPCTCTCTHLHTAVHIHRGPPLLPRREALQAVRKESSSELVAPPSPLPALLLHPWGRGWESLRRSAERGPVLPVQETGQNQSPAAAGGSLELHPRAEQPTPGASGGLGGVDPLPARPPRKGPGPVGRLHGLEACGASPHLKPTVWTWTGRTSVQG